MKCRIRTCVPEARLSQAIAAAALFALMCAPYAGHALQYNETYDLYFINIEDPEDPSDDDGLRFGGNLNKFLYYDKDLTRFTFTDDLHVADGITASGTLITEGRNTFNGVAVFNEDASTTSHVRMESQAEENMFFMDATNNRIGIGTSEPEATLDIIGAISGASLYSFGLSDCSNGTTDKLLWNANTGTFSCGSDQSGGTGGGTASYISVTTESTSTASSAEIDIFQSSSYSALTTTTNASSGITYTPADGRFTLDNDGVYRITLNAVINGGTLTNVIMKLNGTSFFTHDVYIHTSVDPVTRGFTVIKSLTAGDYLEFAVDGGSLTMIDGTTVSINSIE